MTELMNNAAKGDKEAFENIVFLMSPALLKLAKYYSKENPEDILQEIWLKLWEKVDVMSDKEKPQNWFHSVVRYHCVGKFRKEKVKKQLSASISIYSDEFNGVFHKAFPDYDDLESFVVQKDNEEFLIKTIRDTLPEAYSLPIYLHYFETWSLNEISDFINIPVSTVKWRLYTGRQLLKKKFYKGRFY